MKKTLLLAGAAACVLISANASAAWKDFAKNYDFYVGADYVFDSYDFKSKFDSAKKGYNSGMFNVGARMDRVGAELFGQWSGKRTKDTDSGKLKTRVDAYGLDLYGYQPMGCEGKFDSMALPISISKGRLMEIQAAATALAGVSAAAPCITGQTISRHVLSVVMPISAQTI